MNTVNNSHPESDKKQSTTQNKFFPTNRLLTFLLASFLYLPFATYAQEVQLIEGQQLELQNKLQNPLANVQNLPFQNNFDFGYGTLHKMRYTLIFQPTEPRSLKNGALVSVRPIVRLIANPEPAKVFGLGDTDTPIDANKQGKPDSTKKTKSVRFAAVPLINYNRTQGMIVGAMTQAYYKLIKTHTISPASSTVLMGIYTAEKTWLVAIGQQLYLNQDTWRVRAFLVKGNANFQYFNGDANNNAGQYEDYSNEVEMAVGQIQRKIWKRIYAGFYGEYNNTKTYFVSQGDSLDERKLSNLGYVISQDSRDDIQFPTKGIFMNFKNQYYREWTGSDNNFNRYQINYTQFFDLLKDQRHILVARANIDVAAGDVPFQAQSIVGRDDLRGYSQGQFRGNQVYALQSEYRWMFKNSRFGMVAFAGVASAVESFSDIFKTALLPGGGAGLRFRLIPALKVNIGVDVGFGKDDYSLTFRIGEAFAR